VKGLLLLHCIEYGLTEICFPAGGPVHKTCFQVGLIQSKVKGILHYFIYLLEIGSFYHSPRDKQLSFTVFESIQPIFGYLEEYQ